MFSPRQKDTGFTLIEVLVAISLLSLILVLLFNTLFTTSRSWHLGQTKINTNNDLRIASGFIRKYINQAVPIQWQDNGKKQLLFFGNEHEITFVTNLPSHRGGGGLYLVSLRSSEGQSKHLMIQYQYADTGQINSIINSKQNDETILIENIEQLEFSYFGKKEQKDDPDWHSDWNDALLMPELVRCRLSQKDPARIWPEMLMAVHGQVQNGIPEFVIRSKKDNQPIPSNPETAGSP